MLGHGGCDCVGTVRPVCVLAVSHASAAACFCNSQTGRTVVVICTRVMEGSGGALGRGGQDGRIQGCQGQVNGVG